MRDRNIATDQGPDRRQSAASADDAMWDILSLYIDGEATPAQSADVERMLRTDPAYANFCALLRSASGAIGSLGEVEPPITLQASILNATTRRPTVQNRLREAFGAMRRDMARSWPRFAVPVGTIAAASLLAVVWLSHREAGLAHTTPDPGRTVVVANVPHPPGRRTGAIRRADQRTGPSVKPTPSPAPDIITPNLEQARYVIHRDPAMQRHLAANRAPRIASAYLGLKSHGPQVHVPAPFHGAELVINDTAPAPNAHTRGVPYARGMDNVSHRGGGTTAADTSTDLGPPIVPTDTRVASVANADDTTSGYVPTPMAASRPAIHYVALPPEARQIIANSTIKRDMEARNSGYDRDTIESIQRHEVTVAFFKGRF